MKYSLAPGIITGWTLYFCINSNYENVELQLFVKKYFSNSLDLIIIEKLESILKRKR